MFLFLLFTAVALCGMGFGALLYAASCPHDKNSDLHDDPESKQELISEEPEEEDNDEL